jgi:hypothetical protein
LHGQAPPAASVPRRRRMPREPLMPAASRPGDRMGGMSRPWQFSIRDLLLETFWIAARSICHIWASYPNGARRIVEPSQVCFILCGIVCRGGRRGLFRRMTVGSCWRRDLLWSVRVVFGSSLLDQYLNR